MLVTKCHNFNNLFQNITVMMSKVVLMLNNIADKEFDSEPRNANLNVNSKLKFQIQNLT